MGSSAAVVAETQKMKLAGLLIAVLTVLLQMHTISGRGSPQCTMDFPCSNGMCCSSKGYCGTTDAECGAGCQNGPCYRAHGFPNFSAADHSTDGEENVDSKDSTTKESAAHLVTEELFNKVFSDRDSFYTYGAFVAAAKEFSAFGTTGTAVAQKRDVAAFFAHVHHETGGLAKMAEGPHDSMAFCCVDSCLENNPSAKLFSCAPGKKYFARGPLKLTWNFNYGCASKALGADLVAEPELVSKDATMSFKSALWVWMSSDLEQPSGHDLMAGRWSPSASDVAANRLPGFGATIDILKGAAECGHKSPAAAARTLNYIHIAKIFDVSTGPHLECATMEPFY